MPKMTKEEVLAKAKQVFKDSPGALELVTKWVNEGFKEPKTADMLWAQKEVEKLEQDKHE